MYCTGRSFYATDPEIEPLVKFRVNICANIQLDVAGVSATYYLNIACIKILVYVHNLPLSQKSVYF
jgi:hypothetical protein